MPGQRALLLGFTLTSWTLISCSGPRAVAPVTPVAARPAFAPVEASIAVAASPAQRPPGGSQLLPGGASLIVEPDRQARTVAIAAFFAVSAVEEPQPGARHFLERLLLDGESAAGGRSATLRERGAEVVSFTAPDYTAYQIVTTRARFAAGLELIAGLFTEPPISEAALLRQRQAISGELSLAMTSSRTDGAALRALFAAAYAGHPYRLPLLGTVETLSELAAPPLRALHRRGYRPGRLTLVVTGDVDAQEVTAQVTTRLAAIDVDKDAPPETAPRPPSAGPQVTLLPAGSTPQLWLGFATPSGNSADLPALDVATLLLSDDNQRSFLVSGREPGLFVVSTAARSVDDAVRGAIAVALRLGQREVTASELLRVQGQLQLSIAQRSETPAGRAQRLGAFSLLGIDETAYEAGLASLTPSSLRATLSRYLQPQNLTLAVAAPKSLVDEAKLRSLIAEAAAHRPPSPSPAAFTPLYYQLRSGARVVILPDERKKSVALAALWPGGQRLEDERTAGLHELLSRVWPERPASAVITASPQLDPDSFGLRAQFLARDLHKGLSIVRDCVEHPNVSDVDFERGRREVLVQLGVRERGAPIKETEASRTAWKLFLHNLLGSHPYALRPTEQSLTGLSRRRLIDFYRQHYSRDGLVLAVVGDVDPAALLDELAPWLGSATPLDRSLAESRGAALPATTARANSSGGQVFQTVPAQQAHLVLGFAAPGAHSDERAAAMVLFELLAGDEGRLRRALTRRGLAYSFDGLLSPGLSPGYLAFSLAAAPQKLEAADATLRDELHRLVDHPVSQVEVAAARERLQSRLALSSQSLSARAVQLGSALLFGWSDRALREKQQAQLAVVDEKAVQVAARALLREDNMVRAAAIPATRQPLFGMLPPAPRPTLTEYRKNAKNVVSRSAKPGDDRRDGARSKHLPDGRGSRPLSGRLQGLAGHAAKVRREARR